MLLGKGEKGKCCRVAKLVISTAQHEYLPQKRELLVETNDIFWMRIRVNPHSNSMAGGFY